MEWIGTKQGEGCIKGDGGGVIVGEGGYGGEGREEGGHNSMAQLPLGYGPLWTPEKLKEYCGSIGDVNAQIVFVSAHPTFS